MSGTISKRDMTQVAPGNAVPDSVTGLYYRDAASKMQPVTVSGFIDFVVKFLKEHQGFEEYILSLVGGGGETPVTLPDITFSPSVPTFPVGTAQGTTIVTLSAVPSGASRTFSPNDGRLAFNSDKTRLLVGLSAATEGNIAVTITDTHANATNSPRTATFNIAVTGSSNGPDDYSIVSNVSDFTNPTGPSEQASGMNTANSIERYPHVIYAAQNKLRYTWANYRLPNTGVKVNGPNITDFRVSLMDSNGNYYPFLFNGQESAVLAPGAEITGELDHAFAAGVYAIEMFAKRADTSVVLPGQATTAQTYQYLPNSNGTNFGGYNSDANAAGYKANTTMTAYVPPFLPKMTEGIPASGTALTVIGGFGDSKFVGLEDGSGAADGNGNRGPAQKGISAAGLPLVKMAAIGMYGMYFQNADYKAEVDKLIAKANFFIYALVTNDYLFNMSWADLEEMTTSNLDYLHSKGLTGCVAMETLMPVTDGSNVVRSNESVRVAYNNKVNAGWDNHPALIADTNGRKIDVRSVTEDGTTGKWKAGYYDGQGVHPQGDAITALIPLYQNWANAVKAGTYGTGFNGGGGGGGGETVTPLGFSTTDKTTYVRISGANNETATFANSTGNTQSYQRAYVTGTISRPNKAIFGFATSGSFAGSDAGIVLVPREDVQNSGFLDGQQNAFSIRLTEGVAYNNGVGEVANWVNSGVDASAMVMIVNYDLRKWSFRFLGGTWGYNKTVDISTGSGMFDLPVGMSDRDLTIMIAQIFVGDGNSLAWTLLSTEDQIRGYFPGLDFTGYTPIAGAGSSGGGGETSSSDTSGGYSYVTPTGAGDGSDGAYTFGTTAVADPVASRGRLRVALAPLSAGSGDRLTFWAHDHFSTQGVNCNLLEDVNDERITFVTGFLKHLRPALIRVAMTSDDANKAAMYKRLCDDVGCKMVFQGMSFNDYASYGTIAQKAAACVARVKLMGGSQYIAWLEGMNEVDLNLWRFGAANNAAAISMMVQMHSQCYDALKADAQTSGIYIAAPSCTGTNGQISTDVNTAIQGMPNKYDAGNARWYSGKWEPNMPSGGVDGNGYGTIEYELAKARATAGNKAPVVITECGYHNGIEVTLGHLPVREDTASLYMPDIFARPYSQGARVITNYQITDFITRGGRDYTDKSIDQENFGYLRYGAKGVKPAGITMARYNAVIRDDAAPPTMVAIPAYIISGVNSPVKYNFQKSNGQYLIEIKDGRRAVDVDTEKWSGGTQTSPFNPNALLIYAATTGNIKFTSKTWSKVRAYNVHLDTWTDLTIKGDGSYDFPVSQKTTFLEFTP